MYIELGGTYVSLKTFKRGSGFWEYRGRITFEWISIPSFINWNMSLILCSFCLSFDYFLSFYCLCFRSDNSFFSIIFRILFYSTVSLFLVLACNLSLLVLISRRDFSNFLKAEMSDVETLLNNSIISLCLIFVLAWSIALETILLIISLDFIWLISIYFGDRALFWIKLELSFTSLIWSSSIFSV